MYLEETSNYVQYETVGEIDDPVEPTVSCVWCERVQDSDGEWNDAPKIGQSRFASRLIHDICSSCHIKLWAP